MVIWILGFANNRLTIADFRDVGLLVVSLHLTTRLCPLQAFPMPTWVYRSPGFGRVRTRGPFTPWYVVDAHY